MAQNLSDISSILSQIWDGVQSIFDGRLLSSIGYGITLFLVDGVTCIVLVYSFYCCSRIMFTIKDEKFSEYTNKTLISCAGYFMTKYASQYLIHCLGR